MSKIQNSLQKAPFYIIINGYILEITMRLLLKTAVLKHIASPYI